jgi:hypothetical protein
LASAASRKPRGHAAESANEGHRAHAFPQVDGPSIVVVIVVVTVVLVNVVVVIVVIVLVKVVTSVTL